MFDIGWTELAIVALIALLVIGPKELPATMRMIAGWIGKIRNLAREFQSGLDDMMRETELDKLKEQAQGVMHGDLDGMVENTIDPDGTVRDELDYGAGYEPFGDFDDPEPEPKPTPKKRKTAATSSAKSPAKSTSAAAAGKTKKAKSAGSSTKRRAKPAAKSADGGAGKTAAKPRAAGGAKTAAKSKTTSTTAKPAPRKRTKPAKPDTSGAGTSDT